MRIMAIDYGDAHTGVAISDLSGFLAGYTTVINSRKQAVVLDELEKLIREDAEIPVKKTFEYAPEMIHAYLSGKPFRSNVNVPNTGLITNLPENAVVEVPCYTDAEGIHPCYVGDLPDQLAALNTTNILVHQQMAKAMVERRYEYIYEGVKLDPMTAAICTLSQINSMVDELIEANKEYLTYFKNI